MKRLGSLQDLLAIPRRPGGRQPRQPLQCLVMAFNGRSRTAKNLGRGPSGYRFLGLLRIRNDPHFSYFEYKLLLWVQQTLTTSWKSIQCGSDARAKALWHDIFLYIELDMKSIRDIMLLAHMGVAGRTEANEILWNLLSLWALKRDYLDLIHKTTSIVREARRHLKRPPATHRDRGSWRWQRYWEPRHERFSPEKGPRAPFEVVTGPGGVPLEPPQCWREL